MALASRAAPLASRRLAAQVTGGQPVVGRVRPVGFYCYL